MTHEGWREGRRKQINTGEQEGPANERTDAKSSADQRRDASQSSLPVSSLLFLPFSVSQQQGYRLTSSACLGRLKSLGDGSIITDWVSFRVRYAYHVQVSSASPANQWTNRLALARRKPIRCTRSSRGDGEV